MSVFGTDVINPHVCIISVPESLQWEQAVAGQKSGRMVLELEAARGHYRPLGEAWELELDQEAACDWGPHGEERSGKPEWGKEPYQVACTYCWVNMRGNKVISLKHKKHIVRKIYGFQTSGWH